MNTIFNIEDEHFQDGFKKGIEIITTIDRNLTRADLHEIYDFHRSTAYYWSKSDVYDYEKGHTRILYEFLKRYNPKNTFEFMEKYSLEPNNSRESISELLLISIDTMDSMFNSKIVWRKKILKNLLKINRELFSWQLDIVKTIVKAENDLIKGKCDESLREKIIVEKIKEIILDNSEEEDDKDYE